MARGAYAPIRLFSLDVARVILDNNNNQLAKKWVGKAKEKAIMRKTYKHGGEGG